MLHLDPAACSAATALSGGSTSQVHTALAAVRELLPPIAGVLHAPVSPAEAGAAEAAVKAAQAASMAAAQPVSTAASAPGAAAATAKAAGGVAAMQTAVATALAAVMGEEAAAAVGGDEPLMSAGLTSTLAVQLTQQLEERLGTELPGTLVFDYPSINEMAAFLAEEVIGGSTSQAAPATTAAPPARAAPAAAKAAFAPVAPQPVAAPAPPAPAASKAQQEAAATDLVLQRVAQLLGSAADVAPDAPLMSAGLTSTLAVQLTQLLEEAVGAELPGTLVFDYPSAAEMAGFLVAEGLMPGGSAAAAAAPAGIAAALPYAAPAAAGLAAAAAGQMKAALVDLVLGEVANLSGAADVAPDAPLMSAGLTSALAVQLVAALEGAVGAELPGTLVFDYPAGGTRERSSAMLGMRCLGMRYWRHNAAAGCAPLLAHHPFLHPLPLAAAEIADFLISEGLVPANLAAQLAAQLTPSPAAPAVVAVEVSRQSDK